MVTRLIASGIAFGVRVRRALRISDRGTWARNEGRQRGAMLDRERPLFEREVVASVFAQKIGLIHSETGP
jgi:hypothetical protein